MFSAKSNGNLPERLRVVVERARGPVPMLLAMALLVTVGALPAAASCTDVAAPKVDWHRCTLDAGDLAKSSLSGAVLRDASFAFANLAGADLAASEAYHAKFVGANLAGSKLDGASLIEADFTRATLAGASLRGADLRRAHFFRAILRDADLTGADVTGADLLGADLSGALWIDGKHRCAAGSVGRCD